MQRVLSEQGTGILLSKTLYCLFSKNKRKKFQLIKKKVDIRKCFKVLLWSSGGRELGPLNMQRISTPTTMQ